VSFRIRPAAAEDAPFLADMLVVAINRRSGRTFSRQVVMSDPAFRPLRHPAGRAAATTAS